MPSDAIKPFLGVEIKKNSNSFTVEKSDSSVEKTKLKIITWGLCSECDISSAHVFALVFVLGGKLKSTRTYSAQTILNLSLLSLAMVILFSVSACQKKEEVSQEDRLEMAQKKIDQGQYDQALDDVNYVLSRDPKNARALMIKSSVYTARAGIQLKNYVEMNKVTKPIPEALIHPKVTLQVLEVVPQMMAELKWRFELIPSLKNSALSDINMAVSIADQVTGPTRGQLLYRIIIRTILLRSQIENGDLFPPSIRAMCEASNSGLKLILQLQKSKTIMTAWFSDWAAYHPDQKESIDKASMDFQNFADEGQNYLFNSPDLARSDLCKSL